MIHSSKTERKDPSAATDTIGLLRIGRITQSNDPEGGSHLEIIRKTL